MEIDFRFSICIAVGAVGTGRDTRGWLLDWARDSLRLAPPSNADVHHVPLPTRQVVQAGHSFHMFDRAAGVCVRLVL